MKKIKKWRYYCEFCKKSGASAYHMQKHEDHCTMNPRRRCGMCEADPGGDMVTKPMEDLITALLCQGNDYEKGLEVLREVTGNCPACILAAIRQSGIQRPPEDDGEGGCDEGVYLSFNFVTEKKRFWSDQNDAAADYDDCYF